MTALRLQLNAVTLAERAAVPLSFGAAVAAGVIFVMQPALVLLPAVLLPALLLVSSPSARIMFLIFGGLLVFQSSDELTPPKMLFLMGAGVSVVAATVRAQQSTDDPVYPDIEPLLRASRAFVFLIIVSLPVSMAHGTTPVAWLRDVAAYVLFAAAPLLAFDAYSGFSSRALRRLLVVAGLAGSLAFAAQWLSRRGIVSISDVIGLPTFLLGAALFSYALAVVLEGERRRLAWLALAALILAGFASTGTRGAVVFLAAPVAIVLGTRQHQARRSVRLLVVLPAAVFLVALGILTVVRTTGADSDVLSSRARLAYRTGGSGDQSYSERRLQSQASWKLFKQSPIVGVGPGYPISWVDNSGTETSAPTVDSPVSYLAKFGLLGLWPLALLVWAFRLVLKRMQARTGGRSIPQLALIGFAGVVVAWSVLHVPFEDKGIASGFLLLLAIALSESRAALDGRRVDRRSGFD